MIFEFKNKLNTYEEFYVWVDDMKHLIAFRDSDTGEIKIIHQRKFDSLKSIEEINFLKHYHEWIKMKKVED